ncbi:MAG: CZB domain-containing protein, partial [Oceanobacter sp.]
MNESIRERMLKAKSAHQQWLDEAKKLVADNNPDAVNAPVLHTSCEFGRWYYGDGQALKDKPEFQVIDNQHKEIHDLYVGVKIRSKCR